MEDVCVMLDFYAQSPTLLEAMKKYGEARPPDAHAIADLALYNYVEMRDLVRRFQNQIKFTKTKYILVDGFYSGVRWIEYLPLFYLVLSFLYTKWSYLIRLFHIGILIVNSRVSAIFQTIIICQTLWPNVSNFLTSNLLGEF